MVKAGELVRGQRVVDAHVVNPATKQYVRGGKKNVQTLLGRLVVRHTVSAERPLPR